jgi:hypothetical protein
MPSWRDRLEAAKRTAQERAPEMQARTEEAARRAGAAARRQTEKGREKLDQKREERRKEATERERWFDHVEGNTHTEGFPDEESMRLSIEAAAEQGWTVSNIADVPKRRLPGGLTSVLAREAMERVKQSPSFMVTFKRSEPDEPREEPDPSPGSDSSIP